MRRVFEAFREWLQLRSRLREERRFHIDQATADFRALGLSRGAAKRAARTRFGRRAHMKIARREIGGDYAGLLRLLRAYRISASIWLQPLALLSAIALMLLLSPAPRLLLESIAGRPLHTDPTVYFFAPAPWPLFSGITAHEFEAMRSLRSVRGLERYQTIYARAQVAPGAKIAAIESEVRAVTGNSHMSAISDFERRRIEMGPALAIWFIAGLLGVSFLRSGLQGFGLRLRACALGLGFLNLLTSLTAWGLAIQIWTLTPFPTKLSADLVFSAWLLAYVLSVALQCRCCRRDLLQRCPVCLERLLLSSTEGNEERMLLSAAVTESVCAHGHGLLVESRWERRFRQDDMDFHGLIRV
jgi:hypothetical protein